MNEDFFKLEAPVLESEDTELFSGVLKSYGEPVVQAINQTALEHIEDSVTLVNVCLPNLAVVLARQRRDYGISDKFPVGRDDGVEPSGGCAKPMMCSICCSCFSL